MKLRRTAGVIAAIAATTIVASACSAPEVAPEATPDATETAEAPTPGGDGSRSVTVGWNAPMRSQNSLTEHGNATANNNVLYLTNASFFYYADVDGTLEFVMNEDFGTIEHTENEDGSLTVEITLAEGIVWSDGTPLDAADLILRWGAQSGNFNTIEGKDAVDNQAPAGEIWFSGTSTVDDPETPDVNEAHGMSLVTAVRRSRTTAAPSP